MYAYTIGLEINYDILLNNTTPAIKLGKTDYYDGGWVWKSFDDAYKFSLSYPGFAAYLIELPGTWDECVSQVPASDGVHNLLKNSIILRKVLNESA